MGQKANQIIDVLKIFTCIQVDPIDVVAKSHELALFNRVNNFRKSDLSKLLYQDRQAFEYWLQLFSIIPIESYAYLSSRRKIIDSWHVEFQEKNQRALNLVKQYIYQNGPTCSLDLGHLNKTNAIFSWSNSQSTSGLLDFLWDRGELVIHHRVNNRKYYDFAFRTLGNVIKNLDEEQSRDWILESFFQYTGIVRRNFFNRVGYSRELKIGELFESWLKKNKIVTLVIPEVKTSYYCLDSQIESIEKLGSIPINQIVNFLSPLDPLIIDRQIVKDFFDYEYTWEAYIPSIKRRFGYYGMPVLYLGEFIGQLDMKKENGNLKVKNSTLKYPDANSKLIIKKAFGELEEFVLEK